MISRRQLLRCGVSEVTIARRVAERRLHRIHRGVYAIGHRALPTEGRLAAALLYAGPGAALSHLTAAWWRHLLRAEPESIHVSAPGQVSSMPGVEVHRPRELSRTWHRGLPITSVARTLLDSAVVLPFDELRRMLAEAEYQQLVNLEVVAAVLRRGHPGSAALRDALERHQPRLARTLSVLEERFLALCEREGIPLPEVNVTVTGLMVDALWRRELIVVELDGHVAHGSRAAIERDRRRDLLLRAAGYIVLRYTWRQVTEEPGRVAADLRVALSGS